MVPGLPIARFPHLPALFQILALMEAQRPAVEKRTATPEVRAVAVLAGSGRGRAAQRLGLTAAPLLATGPRATHAALCRLPQPGLLHLQLLLHVLQLQAGRAPEGLQGGEAPGGRAAVQQVGTRPAAPRPRDRPVTREEAVP